MPDVYSVITELDPATVDKVASAMEVSAADDRQSRPDCMLSIADRGVDALLAARTIGPALGDALKAETRRRMGSSRSSVMSPA